MKKFIAVTSMLAFFAVSSGLFAQEENEEEKSAPVLKFSGEYVTGVSIQTPNEGDTRAVWWHDDGGASRLRLNLLYESDIGGMKGRIQQSLNPEFTMKIAGSDDLKFTMLDHVAIGGWAYGWINLLDKMVVISAGKIDDSIWGTGGVADVSFDGVSGVRLAVAPIDGLSLGLAVPFAPGNGQELSVPFKNMNFGVKYTASAFTAAVNAKLNSDGNETDEKTGVDLGFGVNVPLGAITVDLSGYFSTGDVINKDKISGSPNQPGFLIGPKVSFKQDAISAYAQLKAKIDTESDDGRPISGTEKDGDASIGFELGGDYEINSEIKPYLNFGSDNVAYLDLNGLYVKLGVKFTLGNGISVDIFDKIRRIGADEDVYKTEGKVNQVQVNFTWAF
jgi:hypothetical protein